MAIPIHSTAGNDWTKGNLLFCFQCLKQGENDSTSSIERVYHIVCHLFHSCPVFKPDAFAILITALLYLKDLKGKTESLQQIFHETISDYGLLNFLLSQAIYFGLKCPFLQIPIPTLPQLFFCLKWGTVSIFYVLVNLMSAICWTSC